MSRKSEKTLLSEFKKLPELREIQEQETGARRGAITRKINSILSSEGMLEDIIISLEKQREERDALDLTMDIHPLDDEKRRAHMAGCRPNVFHYAQRAFSLPIDYRITNARGEGITGKERHLYDGTIDSIVIQPELLGDDFLVGLGIMSSADKKLPPEEKIALKISAIEKVKALLKNAVPLTYGGKTTARILRVVYPGGEAHGKYIVFTGSSGIDPSYARGKKTYDMQARIYPDIFHLIRSQVYALDGMATSTVMTSEIGDDLLRSMIERWKDASYTHSEKARDIGMLISSLGGKKSYEAQRALVFRILKIRFSHSEQDVLRLIGAQHDLANLVAEKLSKGGDILIQTNALIASEQYARGQFYLLTERLSNTLGDILKAVKDGQIADISEFIGSRNVRNLLGKIWHHCIQFHSIDDIRTLGAPYGAIYECISSGLATNQTLAQHGIDEEFVYHIFGVLGELGGLYANYTLAIREHIENIKDNPHARESQDPNDLRIKTEWWAGGFGTMLALLHHKVPSLTEK